MSSQFLEAQSNRINEKCRVPYSSNLIKFYWFRNLYRKTSLGDLSVCNWLCSFDWSTGSPYNENTRSTPADDATDVNSCRI